MIVRDMKARKPYKCNGCPEEIHVGELYTRLVVPAWMDYEADVDDEGRPVAFLRDKDERKFQTLRFHPLCYGDFMGY